MRFGTDSISFAVLYSISFLVLVFLSWSAHLNRGHLFYIFFSNAVHSKTSHNRLFWFIVWVFDQRCGNPIGSHWDNNIPQLCTHKCSYSAAVFTAHSVSSLHINYTGKWRSISNSISACVTSLAPRPSPGLPRALRLALFPLSLHWLRRVSVVMGAGGRGCCVCCV